LVGQATEIFLIEFNYRLGSLPYWGGLFLEGKGRRKGGVKGGKEYENVGGNQ
jgi:hypothetical protein